MEGLQTHLEKPTPTTQTTSNNPFEQDQSQQFPQTLSAKHRRTLVQSSYVFTQQIAAQLHGKQLPEESQKEDGTEDPNHSRDMTQKTENEFCIDARLSNPAHIPRRLRE